MARILEGRGGLANTIDHILVIRNTQEEHDAQLNQVLSHLAKAGVTLNDNKCLFVVLKVSFFGVIVSAQGSRLHAAKVAAFKTMEAPKDVEAVRRLLEMINHLARFLPYISEITLQSEPSSTRLQLGLGSMNKMQNLS